MKNLFLFLMFFGLTYLGYMFFSSGPDYVEDDIEITDSYKQEEEILTYDFEDEAPPEEEQKSVRVEEKEVESDFARVERRFLGPDFRPITDVPNNIKFENEVSPNWEKSLIKEFLDDDEIDANLEIQKLESLVFLKGEVGMYVEKVRIVISEPRDMAGSFYAYVDSSTGEIFHAWEEDEGPQMEMFGGMDEDDFDEESQFTDTVEADWEEGIEYTEEDMYEMGPEEIGYASGYEEGYEEYN